MEQLYSKKGFNMKGQYFSFDAIIATVIMVIAFITLVAYWLGAQSIIDSRANNTYADAIRVADSLFAPGSPSNWNSPLLSLADIKQIGLSNNFDNQFNVSKISRLAFLVNHNNPTPNPEVYAATKNLFRVTDYLIVIESTDGSQVYPGAPARIAIGFDHLELAKQISIADRGASVNGKAVRMRVYVFTT